MCRSLESTECMVLFLVVMSWRELMLAKLPLLEAVWKMAGEVKRLILTVFYNLTQSC